MKDAPRCTLTSSIFCFLIFALSGILLGACSTPAPPPPKPIHISAEDAEKLKLSTEGVKLAPGAKIEPGIGTRFVFHAIIGKDGRIRDLELVSGSTRFLPDVLKTVHQWKYKPYILNGEPVEVETTIDVTVDLAGG